MTQSRRRVLNEIVIFVESERYVALNERSNTEIRE